MNLATLDVSKRQAAEAVIDYRRALKLHRNAEDEAILRGYNAVLKGRKLIQLSEVIKAGGADHQYRPRLAIMRADQRECRVRVRRSGSCAFFVMRDAWREAWARSLRVVLPAGTLPTLPAGSLDVEARSILPSIPPQHRPADKLSNYHILWEATWEDVPADPALLKHIGGDLWAVLAVWNLTELERAVLRGR